MEGRGHHLLAGAGFAPDQDGGVALGHPFDHLEHLAHAARGADDIAHLVAFLQLAFECQVFVVQAFLLPVDEQQVVDRLGDDGGDDGEQPEIPVQVQVPVEFVHGEGADGLVVDFDGHAQEGEFLLLPGAPGPGPV